MEETLNLVNDNTKPKYKGVLGTLRGIFADMKNPTRNGRLYSKECWKHALENEDVKEKLETRTMFGELDHPEDRLETLQERAAIIVTKLEMDEKNQVINGEADILDTPFGRILKTFIDSGVKIGISSRGSGEEVASMKTEGNEIVPETFYLETFDVVALPAVKAARLSLVESKHKDLITEAFIKELNEAKSEQQIKELREYANDNGIIIHKDINTSLGGEHISPDKEEEDNIDVSSEVISKLEEELNVSNTKVKELESLCNMMKNHSVNVVKELKETRIVNEQLNKKMEEFITEKDNLLNEVGSYQMSNKFLKSKLEESANKANSLSEELDNKGSEFKKSYDSLNEELDSYKKLVSSLKEEKAILENKLKESEDSCNRSNDYIATLQSDFNIVKEEKAKLEVSNKKLKEKLMENNNISKKQLEEKESKISKLNGQVSKLDEDLSRMKKENIKLTTETKQLKESYLKSRARDNEVDESEIRTTLKENYNISDIDNKIDEALEIKNSFNKLPFNIGNSILSEGVSIKAPREKKESNNSTLNQMAKVIQNKNN